MTILQKKLVKELLLNSYLKAIECYKGKYPDTNVISSEEIMYIMQDNLSRDMYRDLYSGEELTMGSELFGYFKNKFRNLLEFCDEYSEDIFNDNCKNIFNEVNELAANDGPFARKFLVSLSLSGSQVDRQLIVSDVPESRVSQFAHAHFSSEFPVLGMDCISYVRLSEIPVVTRTEVCAVPDTNKVEQSHSLSFRDFMYKDTKEFLKLFSSYRSDKYATVIRQSQFDNGCLYSDIKNKIDNVYSGCLYNVIHTKNSSIFDIHSPKLKGVSTVVYGANDYESLNKVCKLARNFREINPDVDLYILTKEELPKQILLRTFNIVQLI